MSHIIKGVSKDELKDFDGAFKDFNKAIELDSSYAPAYYNRGISKYELKDHSGVKQLLISQKLLN